MVSVDTPVPLVIEERNRGSDIFSLKINALEYLLSYSNTPLHIIFAWGSQNTGKSTLANSVFGFKFPTISSQTTRGIDLAISTSLGLLCLDIEASDSSERDEEERYYIERILSAFGLAASNLLLYNLYVRDIKTVREVNALSKMMISYLRVYREKRKILFCIRDVSQANNEADLRDKISQTFNGALNKARDATKLGEAEINGIFEYDIATVSVYSDEKFENEAEVLKRIKTKVLEMLRDTQTYGVNSIPSLWSKIWKRLDKDVRNQRSEEILEREKNHEFLRVRRVEKTDGDWKDLIRDFTIECNDLVWKIRDYPHRETGIEELDRKFSARIDQIYQSDPYSKETVLSLYKEEYLTQAIRLEIDRFRYSILRFFENTSENTPNLYSAYIKMFENLDLLDEDRHRIIQARYIKFLHQMALDQDKYYYTIREFLQDTYDRTYRRIKEYESSRTKQSQLIKNRQNILKSELHQLFDSVSKELKPVITRAIKSIYYRRLVRVGLMGISCAIIFGCTIWNIGFIPGGVAAGCCVGFEAYWTRRSLWRSLAEASVMSIQDHESLKIFCKKFKEIVSNRELFLN